MISDVELEEIRNQSIETLKSAVQGVNYFTIILGNVTSLIVQFTEMKLRNVLQLHTFKNIILSFDKERGDFMNKIQINENPQPGVTPENIQELDMALNQVRYILIRFGRVINLFDALAQGHKRKAFNMNEIWKQAPAIRKIQQQESWFGSESSDQARKYSPSSSSSLSSNKYSTSQTTNDTKCQQYKVSNISLTRPSKQIKSPPGVLSDNQQSLNQSHSQQQQERVKEVLEELSELDKKLIFEKFMIDLSQNWKDEHEEERNQSVPLIICRMCSQNFFADREKEHSQNTPRLQSTQNLKILQTPTLSRRSPAMRMLLGSSDNYFGEVDKSSLQQSSSALDLPIIPQEKQKSSFGKQALEVKLENNTSQKSSSSSFEGSMGNMEISKDRETELKKTDQQKVNEQTIKSNLLVPMLNLKSLASIQQPTEEPIQQQNLNPLHKLQMLSGMPKSQTIKNFKATLMQAATEDKEALITSSRLSQKAEPSQILGALSGPQSQLPQSKEVQNQSQPVGAKKTVTAMNTLRGLESVRTIKSFENQISNKTELQSQQSNLSLGKDEITSIMTNVLSEIKNDEKELKTEESKVIVEENQMPEQKFEKLSLKILLPKIEEINASNNEEKKQISPEKAKQTKDLLASFMPRPLGKEPSIKSINLNSSLSQNTTTGQKATPNKNYFAALTSIRKELIKEEMPMSARSPNDQKFTFNFIKDQKQHLDSKKDTSLQLNQEVAEQKVIEQEPIKVIDEIKNIDETQTLQQVHTPLQQVPKSPYLKGMRRRFENLKPQNKNSNIQQKQKEQSISIGRTKNGQITSPYISINQKGLTQEQRKEHIQKLKDHVQTQIFKGNNVNPKNQKDKRAILPISNAFSLNITNEREQILKNMEDLRKSVKLKKRATPLEKIMTKLCMIDATDQDTPNFGEQTHSKDINIPLFQIKPLQTQNQGTLVQKAINNTKINSQNAKLPKLATLQQIDEGNEDDQNVNTPAHKKEKEPKQQVQNGLDNIMSIEKKIDDIGKITKTNKFSGMSPIIAYRPLNRIGLGNSGSNSSNTPMGTPFMLPRSAMTQRDNSDNTSNNGNQKTQHQRIEDQKSFKIMENESFQTAKKEIDILESLKSIAVEIFNISVQIKSYRSQKTILKQYLDQISKIHSNSSSLNKKTVSLLESFMDSIKNKLKSLEELEKVDKKYLKTLPSIAKKQQIEDEKINNNLIQRKMTQSIQGREKQSPGKVLRKASNLVSSSIFFQGNNPDLSDNQDFQQSIKTASEQMKKLKAMNNGAYLQTSTYMMSPQDSPSNTDNYGNKLDFIKTSQISATPHITSRPLQFNNQIENFRNQYQQIPSTLWSLSNINSPKISDPTTGKQNLHAIQEEQHQNRQPYGGTRTVSGIKEPSKQSQFSQQRQKKGLPEKPSQVSVIESSISKQSGTQDDLSKNDFSESESSFSVSDNEGESLGKREDQNFTTFTNNEHFSPVDKRKKSVKSHFSKQQRSKNRTEDNNAKNILTTINDDLSKINTLGDLNEDEKLNEAVNSPIQRKSHFHHSRNFSCNETSSQRKTEGQQKSPVKKSQYFKIKQESKKVLKEFDQDKLSEKYCQSDIVIGNNFDQEFQFDDEDSQNGFSDYHEMFFVHELFQDYSKFENVLLNALEQENIEKEKKNDNYNFVSAEVVDEIEISEDSDSEDEILTMNRVRFNSLCILPSQIDSCSLENYWKDQDQVTIHDFILLKTVASGAYGKVILARKKNTSDLFAVKVLDKEKMVEKNVTQYVMNEREILNTVNNDFIVRGVYTFQSKKFLYMVMEFMKGGDFASLLGNDAIDEETAKYYLSQIILALEYLHKNGVIHRDLKPENILIDADGHIKLTDFGLSETGLKHLTQKVSKGLLEDESVKEIDMQKDIQNVLGLDANQLKETNNDARNENQVHGYLKKQSSDEKTALTFNAQRKSNLDVVKLVSGEKQNQETEKKKRILGTADYMAPEVIQGEDHTHSLDFWSLGVMAYEFLTGALPFNSDTPEKVFQRILKRDIKFPPVGIDDDMMSPEAYDFINKLLETDPKKRLGFNDINEIKNHLWLKDIDWDHIMDAEAPFKPLGRDQDAGYFPKATDKDEELKTIIEDQSSQARKQIVKEFNKFDSISYGTLQSINAKEAKKAIDRAKRMAKRQQNMKIPKIKQSMKYESIIMDLSRNSQMEKLVESKDEDNISPINQL